MTVTAQQLDASQYSKDSIHLYEQVYGIDFISPGGRDMAIDLITQLNQPQNAKVLDAGCGLGGSAFTMATEFGLRVTGIDLSRNMIERARQKLQSYGLQNQVRLQQADCTALNEHNCYDAIYSRDVFLHIENKSRLFNTLYKALKPDGSLLFTDYSCGPQPWQPDFSAYVKSRNYDLHTIDNYVALVDTAGFRNTEAIDSTELFIDLLGNELSCIEKLDICAQAKKELSESWNNKLLRAKRGDQRWIKITATK